MEPDAIHNAVTDGDLEKVLELMKAKEDEYNSADPNDQGGLDQFINPPCGVSINYDLILGDDWRHGEFFWMDDYDQAFDVTPLHLAALHGHEEIFNTIFEKVNLNLRQFTMKKISLSP